MEDDDFGDLYTDVLTTSFQASQPENYAPAAGSKSTSFQGRSIDLNVNSDDEEIMHGAQKPKNSNSQSADGLNLNVAIEEKALPEPRGFDLNLDSNQEGKGIPGLAGNEGGESKFEARASEKGEGVKLPEWTSGGSNFVVEVEEEEEEDINIVVEEGDNKDDDLVEKDENLLRRNENANNSVDEKKESVNLASESGLGEIGSEPMIPGLSGEPENRGGAEFEDEWESEESEDDLQIVLNDNNHGPLGMERMTGMDDNDDEDGDPLVIVADNGDTGHHHLQMTEEQVWDGEDVGPGTEGERKELGEVAKASGGGAVAATVVQPKIGFSNHAYHHPFHSQFKYVRPGAAPIPGAAPVGPGGTPGQVRPTIPMGPIAGRGRGDWRPVGITGAVPMQKGFRPGYGMPVWGANAGRGFGSGLDFTLPSHKTIFEVDIESFEERPWRLPGIDISDFFNFGLNEDTWKDYCKQLEQLRLETTMQSKIRVYESGRTEQEYDPDLPPELAAAVGIQDISSENANLGTDAGSNDLARARGRPPLPVGRPIPVETGSGDRLPSIDTRRPRMHDSDAIIEIMCQADDDDMAEQQENDHSRKDLRGNDEIDDLPQENTENYDGFSHAYDDRKKELVGRSVQIKKTVRDDDIVGDDALHLPSEAPGQYHSSREFGVPREERRTTGRARVGSPNMASGENERERQQGDNEKEESFDSGDGNHSPMSSPVTNRSAGEQAVSDRGNTDNDLVVDDRSFEMDREEMALDATINIDAPEEENSTYSTKKQAQSSRAEEPSQENDGGEDSKAARSSENSKPRSESSKDYRKFHDSVEDEVLQDDRSMGTGNIRRPVGYEDTDNRKGHRERQETRRHRMAVKGGEDSYAHRGADPNSSVRRHVKSESVDRRKESDVSEGGWHRRDEDIYGRRMRLDDMRNREHGGEIGSRHRSKVRESDRSEKEEYQQPKNQLDNSSWRGANHDKDLGSKHRDRGDNFKRRNENVDDLHSKRSKEELPISREHNENEGISHNNRENSSRRKRERDDVLDQRKRDDQARMKNEDLHYVRLKEEGSYQRERNERQRERDEWHRLKQSHEEILSRREREETRAGMRSGRAAEDKTWTSHSRGKDEYKGSGREHYSKDIGRQGEQLKRRDRAENESLSQHRGYEDVYGRVNQLSNNEKRARHERPTTREERVAFASDTSRLHENKHKESSRKTKESEAGDHSFLIPSKRNQDGHWWTEK
ncbi:FIP1[V]-like protein [Forsythia ovata]|uniref:FIP1[V]-like protein n=1 Tax=Forsythia ovata TaxID=205694 RepID=A0ABD1R2W5_9LAMI